MTSTHTANQPDSQAQIGWRCGDVSLSRQGYQRSEDEGEDQDLAIQLINQTLQKLGLQVPEKTFIRRLARGFHFLGIQFQAGKQLLSMVTHSRLNTQLTQKFTSAARLYEQGRLRSLKSIELYLTHWLRYQKGIGIASLTALDALKQQLIDQCNSAPCLMIETFTQTMVAWVKTPRNIHYENIIQSRFDGTYNNHSRALAEC